MRKLASFLSGAIMGGLVGATLALLLAPSSGDELRSQLEQRVQTIRDDMGQAASSRRAELEAQLTNLRASGGERAEVS